MKQCSDAVCNSLITGFNDMEAIKINAQCYGEMS